MTDTRELPSTFHQHYLDDPYFDFAEDDAEHGGKLFVFACVVFPVLLFAMTALNWWLRPPQVTFQPVVAVPASQVGVKGFTDGTPSYTWSVSNSNLPAGLSITTTAPLPSGTVSVPYRHAFKVKK